jgi:hypothetical protein
MLLDERLIPDLRHTRPLPRNAGVFQFRSAPRLTMREIRRIYGAPDAESRTAAGEILVYGIFRILSDACGQGAVVLFGR